MDRLVDGHYLESLELVLGQRHNQGQLALQGGWQGYGPYEQCGNDQMGQLRLKTTRCSIVPVCEEYLH